MAGVVVEMSAREAQLHGAIAKLERQQETLKRKLADTGRQGRSSGEQIGRSMKQANEESFGTRAQSMLKSYLTGFIGIGTAVASVVQGLRDMNRVRDEGAQKIREAEMGLSSLTQLAMGDPVRLQSLIRGAKQIYRGGGARTLDEAARTMFALESAGAGGLLERDLFSKLFGIVEQPDVMARAATTLLTAMGGRETGGLRAILSKGFAASQFAPASAEEILEAAGRGAGAAGMLGMRDEAVLAAVSLLSQASGTAEIGGTQLSAYLTQLVKRGEFKGMTLPGSVRAIEAMGLSDKELAEYLGNVRAIRAFATLRLQLPELEKRIGAVGGAQEGDLLGQMIRSRQAQPELAAALLERQTRAEAELANEMGVGRLLSEAQLNRWVAERRLRGRSEFWTQLGRRSFEFQRGLGLYGADEGLADPQMLRILEASRYGTLIAEDTPQASLERAASEMRRTAENMAGGPLMAAPHEDR